MNINEKEIRRVIRETVVKATEAVAANAEAFAPMVKGRDGEQVLKGFADSIRITNLKYMRDANDDAA